MTKRMQISNDKDKSISTPNDFDDDCMRIVERTSENMEAYDELHKSLNVSEHEIIVSVRRMDKLVFTKIERKTEMVGIMTDAFKPESRPLAVIESFDALITALANKNVSQAYKNEVLKDFRESFIGEEFNQLNIGEQLKIAMRYVLTVDDDDIHDVLVEVFGLGRFDLFPTSQPVLLIALILLKVKKRVGVHQIYHLLKEVSEAMTPEDFDSLLCCAEELDAEINHTNPKNKSEIQGLIAAKILNFILDEEMESLISGFSTDDSFINENEAEDLLEIQIDRSSKFFERYHRPTNLGDIHPEEIFPKAELVCDYLEVLYENHPVVYEWVIADLAKRAKDLAKSWEIISRNEVKYYTGQLYPNEVNMAVALLLKRNVDDIFDNFFQVEINQLKKERSNEMQGVLLLFSQKGLRQLEAPADLPADSEVQLEPPKKPKKVPATKKPKRIADRIDKPGEREI